MKKFLLAGLFMALSFVAEAQVVPLKVYNGMPFTIRLNSVAVRDLNTCGAGTTVVVNIAIPPGGTYTVSPLQPGDATVDWAGAKVSDIPGTSVVRAIHPYFEACWLPSLSIGPVTMTGYWYAINSTPYQLLKIY